MAKSKSSSGGASGAFDGIAKAIGSFKTIQSTIETVVTVFQKLTKVIEVITPVVETIGGVFAELGPIIEVATVAVEALGAAFAILQPEITIVVAAGIALVAVARPIGRALYSIGEAIYDVGKYIFDAAKAAVVFVTSFSPIESVFNAITSAWSKVAGVVSAGFNTVKSVFNSVVDGAKSLVTGFFGVLDAEKKLIVGLASGVQEAAQSGSKLLQLPMQALQGVLGSIGTQINQFVAKLNPGYLIRWNMAVDDLYASIGQALLPVLQSFTATVRVVANTVNGLSSNGQLAIRAIQGGVVALGGIATAAGAVVTIASGGVIPALAAIGGGLASIASTSQAGQAMFKRLASVFGGVMNEMGDAIRKLEPSIAPVMRFFEQLVTRAGQLASYWARTLGSLGPEFERIMLALEAVKNGLMPLIQAFQGAVIGILTEGLSALARAASAAAPYIILAADYFGKLTRSIGSMLESLFGLHLPHLDLPGSPEVNSTGKAARSTSFGSTEDLLKKAMQSAYSLGSGGKQKPEDKMASAADKLAAEVASLKNSINEFIDTVKTVSGFNLAKNVSSNVAKTTSSITEEIKGGIKRVTDMFPAFSL